jgi:SH3-like domain-containing protein
VTRDGVILRAGFGKKAPVSWHVRKYTPLKKLGQPYNGWVRVKDLEGDKHWLKETFFTEKYHCVMIKSDRTAIRVGPGLKYNEKFKEPGEKYETFKFIKAKRGWVEVKDVHGDIGWLKFSDVWVD